MGLASQSGNRVTVSYRQDQFSRIKERNARRIEEFIRSRKITVLFKSNPVEFKPDCALQIQSNSSPTPSSFRSTVRCRRFQTISSGSLPAELLRTTSSRRSASVSECEI